jgi:hypothetical protein
VVVAAVVGRDPPRHRPRGRERPAVLAGHADTTVPGAPAVLNV